MNWYRVKLKKKKKKKKNINNVHVYQNDLFIYFFEKSSYFFLICYLFIQNYKGIYFFGYGAVIFS